MGNCQNANQLGTHINESGLCNCRDRSNSHLLIGGDSTTRTSSYKSKYLIQLSKSMQHQRMINLARANVQEQETVRIMTTVSGGGGEEELVNGGQGGGAGD